MFPIITGVAAGALHVFTGPDHLAALAPAAVADPPSATKTGVAWGLGHGIGVLVIGLVGLVFRGMVDRDVWSAWAEFLVGFLIVAIGAWAIWRSRTLEIHQHRHDHDVDLDVDHGHEPHEHLHAHAHGQHRHHRAVMGIGVFHGMAGGGHLFGVLPALALPTTAAVVYLFAYLVSSVAAMGAFATFIGAVATRSSTDWIQRLMLISGIVAVVVGLAWVINAWPF